MSLHYQEFNDLDLVVGIQNCRIWGLGIITPCRKFHFHIIATDSKIYLYISQSVSKYC